MHILLTEKFFSKNLIINKIPPLQIYNYLIFSLL